MRHNRRLPLPGFLIQDADDGYDVFVVQELLSATGFFSEMIIKKGRLILPSHYLDPIFSPEFRLLSPSLMVPFLVCQHVQMNGCNVFHFKIGPFVGFSEVHRFDVSFAIVTDFNPITFIFLDSKIS